MTFVEKNQTSIQILSKRMYRTLQIGFESILASRVFQAFWQEDFFAKYHK